MFAAARRLIHRPAPIRPPRPAPPAAPERAEDRPRGCGWFDSSHELQTGLRVDETLPPETVARLVPLSWWLAWELDAALPSVR
jgi:hypothetical protein